jgi:hypothetical protein
MSVVDVDNFESVSISTEYWGSFFGKCLYLLPGIHLDVHKVGLLGCGTRRPLYFVFVRNRLNQHF